MLDWLPTLELNNPIFAEDAKFTKSAGEEAGKTYESWFDKALERIKFYSKTHKLLVTNATAHLEDLRAELIQRSESRQLVRQETIDNKRELRELT